MAVCHRVLLFVVCAFVLTNSADTTAQEKKKEAVAAITAPKDGGKVDQTDQVEGKLNTTEGWPVVVIKPLVGIEPWWVQPPVEELKDGEFSIQAHFGNEETKPGTKFRVMIFVAKSKTDAHSYKANTTLKALPPESKHPRSEPVEVERK